jgi:anti-sigma regulatory factor (Ser/Thr protein kinase)
MSTLRQAAPPTYTGLQDAMSVEEVYAAAPLSVPRARHLVTSVLRDWGLSALRPDAALIVTELAANAAGQGESATPAEVLVRISRTAGDVVIQVGDHNPAGPPSPPCTVPGTAENGRGLLISRALAADLGWCIEGDWKIVWAVLRNPPVAGEQEAVRGQLGRAA